MAREQARGAAEKAKGAVRSLVKETVGKVTGNVKLGRLSLSLEPEAGGRPKKAKAPARKRHRTP